MRSRMRSTFSSSRRRYGGLFFFLGLFENDAIGPGGAFGDPIVNEREFGCDEFAGGRHPAIDHAVVEEAFGGLPGTTLPVAISSARPLSSMPLLEVPG